MKRALIQLDEGTYGVLRQRAFEQGRSISSLARELISTGLELRKKNKPKHVRQFSFIGSGKSRQERLSPVSERHDEALAALKR